MISKEVRRFYDPTFSVSEAYRESLPDLQNGAASLIEGANVPIQQVGIADFKLPLKFRRREGEALSLEASIDGYVSLEMDKKGINMSRIMRTFYKYKEEVFHLDRLEDILRAYKKDLKSQEAYLRITFNYPMMMKSLRSDLEGYQYYKVSFEGKLDNYDRFYKFMHLDFEYSSACPCSYELAEHAREHREVAAIPHSQRSVANVTVALKDEFFVEDLVNICRNALNTETQVMVKREDEQAFAEMNGAYQKFVEDAARLLYEELDSYNSIRDFVVRCVHMESLHSHDAVSRICKGLPNGLR
ncbi:MAG: GTP cyclohydrolase I FolE2 [Balneolaceae bacterium]|nr:GTP cyclohydrolase I FolE2 [Balneolaceae bacterium]